MIVYENQHFKIYKYNDDLYRVEPKDNYPAFYINKMDMLKLIKECETIW